ncbi:MAG: phosphonopyruvate decarboxylase [Gammaproteobacteria bacterium]|nr:phosphonopyruvate decarboxylase [Gammaproteobacteria bacterium]
MTIEASDFVDTAKQLGYSRYTGVPCSFLTPFINYVINDTSLNYISSANEGDALATAAGAAVGGERAVVMMQNSGLGNAVSPLTSLAWVFRIPLLLICTHRGAPDVSDEPQHELMGRITGDMLTTMEVPWEVFPASSAGVMPALLRAGEYLHEQQRPFGFLMRKDTVAAHELQRDPVPCADNGHCRRQYEWRHGERPSRREALDIIRRYTPEQGTVVIATTGYTGRELYALGDRPNQLYMVGSMGCASSFALGLALARPDLKVVVIDGDGAALMRMGNFATAGIYAGPNFHHILLDNEVHDSTGAQATVAGGICFADIATACGYALAIDGDTTEVIEHIMSADTMAGPRFAHLKIRSGTLADLPRPAITPPDILRRLMQHIGSHF